MYFSLVIIGAFHGLIFLPILLSYFGSYLINERTLHMISILGPASVALNKSRLRRTSTRGSRGLSINDDDNNDNEDDDDDADKDVHTIIVSSGQKL